MAEFDPYPKPPDAAQRYVDALGVETAIEFLLNFGGAELYFPDDPKGNGEVERVIGAEKMRCLTEASGHLKNRVPLATRWLAQCLSIQGLSTAAIARRLRVSDVTVRKYLSGTNETRNTGKRPNQTGKDG